MKRIVFLIIGVIILVEGCNNYCSGHGTCEARDECKCFPGFGGADCSLSINHFLYYLYRSLSI